MYNFFTHSSINEHLAGFHVLAIVNGAAMNNGTHVSFSILVSSGYMPRSGIAGCMVVLFLVFKEPPYCLPEKAMATHSGTLAWKMPWTEEPGRLQSMGLLRVRHD